jgi:hypothetical protein
MLSLTPLLSHTPPNAFLFCTCVRQEAMDAVAVADAATLMDMGFSKGKAKEALLACGGDVQAACEWLFANC